MIVLKKHCFHSNEQIHFALDNDKNNSETKQHWDWLTENNEGKMKQYKLSNVLEGNITFVTPQGNILNWSILMFLRGVTNVMLPDSLVWQRFYHSPSICIAF